MRKRTKVPRSDHAAWFPGLAARTQAERACPRSVQASFAKAAGMDFYITKYQGKMVESMAPLFQSILGGMQRFEPQERAEQEEEAPKVPWLSV